MKDMVAALKKTSGHPLTGGDLACISPLLSARLLVSGRHNFDAATPPEDLQPP